jgi:hypothetical protein
MELVVLWQQHVVASVVAADVPANHHPRHQIYVVPSSSCPGSAFAFFEVALDILEKNTRTKFGGKTAFRTSSKC